MAEANNVHMNSKNEEPPWYRTMVSGLVSKLTDEIFVHMNSHISRNQDVSASVITHFQHSIVTYSRQVVTKENGPKAITSTHRRSLLADLGSETESDDNAKHKKKKGKSKLPQP